MRHRYLFPLFILVMMGSLVFSFVSVAADTTYESYTSGEDTDHEIYGDNWAAQTFTVNTTVHTVSQLQIKAYKTGSPGTVTVSIRHTDDSGDPFGEDITSGTIDADAEFSGSSPGDWETVTVTETSLEYMETYAIVVRAVGGDASNKVHWRANSAGSYSGGKRYYSASAGSSWSAASAVDHMFKVDGNSALDIIDVKVFSSVVDDGDWYICVHYFNIAPPGYPNEDPERQYSLQLMEYDGINVTVLAQVRMPSWGYKPAAIYISADAAAGLDWGSASYMVFISANDDVVEYPFSDYYTLNPTDWVGSELFWLDEWVRGVAEDMETYYGEDFIATTIGDTTFPDGVLTYLGGQVFIDGMYGLEEVRPNLFYVLVRSQEWESSEYAHEYQESLDYETQLGTQIATAIDDTADIFGVSGRLFGGVGIFVVCVGMIGLFAGTRASPFGTMGAVVLAVPVFIMGAWLDLIPIAVIAVVATFCILFFVWIMWLRGT